MKRPFMTALVLAVLCDAGAGQEPAPLSMADAERIALESHPSVRAAEAALSAAHGRFWRGVAPPPPSLSLDHSYIPLGRPTGAFGERTMEVSQTLDFPLLTIARGAQLSHQAAGQEHEVVAVQREVVERVKRAYVSALAARERRVLALQSLAVADSFLHDAGVRHEAGEGTRLELLTARAHRTRAANELESARSAEATAQSELRAALGWSPAGPTRPLVLSDDLAYRERSLRLDSLQDAAQQTSPLILAARERQRAAESERSSAWMSLLPSLTLAYFRQTVGDNPNLYGVRLGISLPVWFLLDTRGQVQEASAGAAMASEQVRAMQHAVALEVASAYAAYTDSRRRVELEQREMLPEAEEVFRVASVSYHAGEAGYVEFLQAMQGLIAARSASLDALVEHAHALIRLERSVGLPLMSAALSGR